MAVQGADQRIRNSLEVAQGRFNMQTWGIEPATLW